MKKQLCHCDSISVDKLKKMGIPEGYCGVCEICSNPGHIRHYPSSVPYTGAWCDSCFVKLKRKEKIKIVCITTTVAVVVALLITYQFFIK